jgi:hypothetical protein
MVVGKSAAGLRWTHPRDAGEVARVITIVPFAAWLALLIFALLDIDGSPADRVRCVGAPWWVLVVVALPVVGSVAWIMAGRPRVTRVASGVRQPSRSLAWDPGPGEGMGMGPTGTPVAPLDAILDQIDREFDLAVRRRKAAAPRSEDGSLP